MKKFTSAGSIQLSYSSRPTVCAEDSTYYSTGIKKFFL